MFGTLLLGLIVLLFVWDYLNKKHRYEVLKKSKIGGKSSLPIVGNALQMRGLDAENSIDRLRTLTRENGKIFRSWVLHQLVIFDADPKDLEIILSSPTHITKNIVYDMLSLWLGDGLLLSDGKKWHTRRKIITPTLHFKILEQFINTFDVQSTVMAEKLAQYADGTTTVDIFPIVCLTALDIISETAMGVKVNAQLEPNIGYPKAVKIVTQIIAERLRRPTWRMDWLFRLVAPERYNTMMHNINEMKTFTKNVITQRRAALQQEQSSKLSQVTNDDEVGIGTKKREALLDVLLKASVDGKPLSDEDIREEVETFMFEGHDTTTSGISFAIYLISRNPVVQRKLFAEIRDVMGDDKAAAVTHRQLQDLKYMECVLKESMRLYPPVPIVGRYFSEDYKLNERTIPGKTHLNMALFVVLRDPDYFPNPNDFIPERFDGGESANKIDPFAYLPFSAGPRNCIGQKYAMLEMKSNISKLLRFYELLPMGEDVVPILSLIMRSKTGVNVGLKPRVYK